MVPVAPKVEEPGVSDLVPLLEKPQKKPSHQKKSDGGHSSYETQLSWGCFGVE